MSTEKTGKFRMCQPLTHTDLGCSPAHHVIEQLTQGNACRGQVIFNDLRWMGHNNMAHKELILFQLPQLLGEHFFTDPGHASLQRPEPVDVVLDQV